MKINPDFWLDGVKRMPIPGGQVLNLRRFLIIHFTDGATAESSVSWWKNPKARGSNAHIVIDRDGSVIQCRPFNRTCGHAGKARWRDPKTGLLFASLNSCSIGIELANGGADEPGPDGFDWAKKQPGFQVIKAAHKHGGPVREWEAYPAAQLASCDAVSLALVDRFNLDDLVGHEDISRGRKTDPGPAFPMAAARAKCGFTGPIPLL